MSGTEVMTVFVSNFMQFWTECQKVPKNMLWPQIAITSLLIIEFTLNLDISMILLEETIEDMFHEHSGLESKDVSVSY